MVAFENGKKYSVPFEISSNKGLLQLSGIAWPLLTQCPSTPSALLMSARQQWWHAAKMTNNVGLLDMWEIARIVASNTARIDLPMRQQSEPYFGDSSLTK